LSCSTFAADTPAWQVRAGAGSDAIIGPVAAVADVPRLGKE
jgi:hypothetical protein